MYVRANIIILHQHDPDDGHRSDQNMSVNNNNNNNNNNNTCNNNNNKREHAC
jgi:hypothetical protein